VVAVDAAPMEIQLWEEAALKCAETALQGGDDISSNPLSLDKISLKAFSSQYSDEHLEQFRQLPSKKKALIIDDWHRSKLNSKGVAEFLCLAREEFGIIVTFGARRSWLEDMLEASTHNETSDFSHCEIREFGHRLREQILFKWHSLGQEYELEKAQIIKNVASSGSQLNAILGKGFFPSYPLFMLYTLQILSIEQTDARIHGSYGHIYEAFTHRFRDTDMLSRGASPYDVAKILADTIATVERHYAPFTKELRERVRGLIDNGEGLEKTDCTNIAQSDLANRRIQ